MTLSTKDHIGIWRVAARHVDSTEKRALLEYLAASGKRWHPLGELATHTEGDQLILITLLEDLARVGLVRSERRAGRVCVSLSPLPGLRHMLSLLPEYYARLHR